MTWAARAQRTGPIVVKAPIASLAHSFRERESYGDSLAAAECTAVSAILDRLEADG
jgi:hypothetical protein